MTAIAEEGTDVISPICEEKIEAKVEEIVGERTEMTSPIGNERTEEVAAIVEIL